MDKHELRDRVADEIVSVIYQQEIRVVKSKLEGRIKTQFAEYLTDYKKSINFVSAVISSLEQENVLLTEDAVIGLTPLGRKMCESGGYIKYKAMCAQAEKEKKDNEERQRRLDRTHKITVSTCAVLTLAFTVLSFFLTPKSVVWSHLLYMAIGVLIGVAIAAQVEALLRYLINRVRDGR